MGIVRVNIKKGCTTYSEASTSHNDFHFLYNHKGEVAPYMKTHKILPWVHICMWNAKWVIEAVHHMVMPQFLQYSLDLMAYKMNRCR